MSGYFSTLFLVIGVSLVAVVGLVGLIFLEVKRMRRETSSRTAEGSDSICN